MKSAGRIKLGIVANEFFAPELGRTGGFGWAARAAARCFTENRDLGVDVIFLSGELQCSSRQHEIEVYNTRLLLKQPIRLEYRRTLAVEKIDVLLAIDYRPSYRLVFWMLPFTPIIVWARDPRTPADVARISTLRIPGADQIHPQGIDPIDCTSLATVARISKVFRRPVLLASKMPHIAEKLFSTYGIASQHVLPNPDILPYRSLNPKKSDRPSVVFLGRQDPYKRPWLFVELARNFPDADFFLLGRSHFRGPGSWQPGALPTNVKLMGQVHGAEKIRVLCNAWVLVNTSVYEESPVSMLEALTCRTPILSCVETGNIVSRFGIYTGRFDGAGLDALPKLNEGLKLLLHDHKLRTWLGEAGLRWVQQQHNTSSFVASFARLCALAGLSKPCERNPN